MRASVFFLRLRFSLLHWVFQALELIFVYPVLWGSDFFPLHAGVQLSAPFAEETVLPPWNSQGTLTGNRLTVHSRV